MGRQSLFAAALLAVAGVVLAQPAVRTAAGPHKPIYMYQGADRDQKVLEGARKEKQVVVYTSLNTKDSIPITQAFEKKYGVKVELWRSSSEKVHRSAISSVRSIACASRIERISAVSSSR